jgi:hypothetical protein
MRKKGGWRFACACLASVITGMFWAATALAVALVADLEGDVRVSVAGSESQAIAPGQRVASGSLVTTGAGARVMLRFDDGLWAALHENSKFRIEDYRFREQEPAADRSVLVLLQGALRIVTGLLGRRNPDAFTLHAPKLIVGVRGTDFLVAIADRVYLSVREGRVAMSNAAGTTTFAAGEFGAADEDTVRASPIAAGELPGAVRAAFGGLGAARMSPHSDARPQAPAAAKAPEAAKFGREAVKRSRGLKEKLPYPAAKSRAK